MRTDRRGFLGALLMAPVVAKVGSGRTIVAIPTYHPAFLRANVFTSSGACRPLTEELLIEAFEAFDDALRGRAPHYLHPAFYNWLKEASKEASSPDLETPKAWRRYPYA
jgi:hypothetical protein